MPKQFLLHDLEAGADYAVQVRARGFAVHRPDSPWTPSLDFTTVLSGLQPKAPDNLTVQAVAGGFVVTWDAPTQNIDNSPLEDFRDYRVQFYDPAVPATVYEIYVDETELFLPLATNVGLFGAPQADVDFDVSVRTAAGTYGVSAIASGSQPAPAAPTLSGADADYGVVLTWDAGDVMEVQQYLIYVDAVLYGTVGGNTLYATIQNADDQPHDYMVRAVTWYGQTADSNTVSVTFTPPAGGGPHTHTESDITDLDHDAVAIQGVAVDATAPTADQALLYDDISGTWKPGDISIVAALDDLTDVDTTTTPPTDGQALVFDSNAGTWVPGTVSGGGGGGASYTTTIGDGVAKSYTVTHNLGTDVDYRLKKSNGLYVHAPATVEDSNSLTVWFYEPPGVNAITIVVESV